MILRVLDFFCFRSVPTRSCTPSSYHYRRIAVTASVPNQKLTKKSNKKINDQRLLPSAKPRTANAGHLTVTRLNCRCLRNPSTLNRRQPHNNNKILPLTRNNNHYHHYHHHHHHHRHHRHRHGHELLADPNAKKLNKKINKMQNWRRGSTSRP